MVTSILVKCRIRDLEQRGYFSCIFHGLTSDRNWLRRKLGVLRISERHELQEHLQDWQAWFDISNQCPFVTIVNRNKIINKTTKNQFFFNRLRSSHIKGNAAVLQHENLVVWINTVVSASLLIE